MRASASRAAAVATAGSEKVQGAVKVLAGPHASMLSRCTYLPVAFALNLPDTNRRCTEKCVRCVICCCTQVTGSLQVQATDLAKSPLKYGFAIDLA